MATKKTGASKTSARKTSASKTGASKTGRSAKSANRSTKSTTAKRAAGKSRGSKTEHTSHALADHDEIQTWAEERGAVPACVKGTGGGGDLGMIRLDFPGYSGEESLQEVSWDDWFEQFDANNLALLVQDRTAGGEPSNFNKLVKRSSVQQKPRTRTAR